MVFPLLWKPTMREEVARAVKAGAKIVGVNNRNLKDFTVDIQNSVRLRDKIPKELHLRIGKWD